MSCSDASCREKPGLYFSCLGIFRRRDSCMIYFMLFLMWCFPPWINEPAAGTFVGSLLLKPRLLKSSGPESRPTSLQSSSVSIFGRCFNRRCSSALPNPQPLPPPRCPLTLDSHTDTQTHTAERWDGRKERRRQKGRGGFAEGCADDLFGFLTLSWICYCALLMFLPTQTWAKTPNRIGALFQMFELQLQTFFPPQCFAISDRRAWKCLTAVNQTLSLSLFYPFLSIPASSSSRL